MFVNNKTNIVFAETSLGTRAEKGSGIVYLEQKIVTIVLLCFFFNQRESQKSTVHNIKTDETNDANSAIA